MILPYTLFATYFLTGLTVASPDSGSSVLTLSCTDVDLDLLLLIEATLSIGKRYPEWSTTIQGIVEYIANKFENTRIGLASFTDKPIPFRGQGKYGNYQDAMQDYCYEHHLPLAQYDSVALKQRMNEISSKKLSGLDAMQNQLEGILFSVYDSAMDWKNVSQEGKENECHVSSVLVFTASQQHRPNDAKSALNDWNWERLYSNGYDKTSYGGFGSDDFPNLGGLNLATEEDKNDYETLASYYHIMDGFAAGASGYEKNITKDQEKHLLKLLEKFGPYPFPALEHSTHPGNASIEDCSLTEYPGPSAVGKALSSKSIIPAFFVTSNVYNYYENQLLDLGVDSIILQMDSTVTPQDLADALLMQLGVPIPLPTEPVSTSTSISTKVSSTSTSITRSTKPEATSVGDAASSIALADEKSTGTLGEEEVSTTTELVLDSGVAKNMCNVECLVVTFLVFFKMI